MEDQKFTFERDPNHFLGGSDGYEVRSMLSRLPRPYLLRLKPWLKAKYGPSSDRLYLKKT